MANKQGNPNPKISHSTKIKKGEVRNPYGKKGRPDRVTLTKLLEEMGEIEDCKHEGEKVSRREKLCHVMWAQALRGKDATQRYIYDRIDGKPALEIKVQGGIAIDAPIVLQIGAKIETVDDVDADTDTE